MHLHRIYSSMDPNSKTYTIPAGCWGGRMLDHPPKISETPTLPPPHGVGEPSILGYLAVLGHHGSTVLRNTGKHQMHSKAVEHQCSNLWVQ